MRSGAISDLQPTALCPTPTMASDTWRFVSAETMPVCVCTLATQPLVWYSQHSEKVVVEWMKALRSQAISEWINWRLGLKWPQWILSGHWGCLFTLRISPPLDPSQEFPRTWSLLCGNLQSLQEGSAAFLWHSLHLGDTKHYKAILHAKPNLTHSDSKPLKFREDIIVSFDLLTKEQVRWKGYSPLKNILTTNFKKF